MTYMFAHHKNLIRRSKVNTFFNLTSKARNKSICLTIVPLLFCAANINAGEIDWNSVDAKTVTTFYPGVASWEYLQREDHGNGANPVKKMKKSCAACHVNKKGKYDIAADEIISGELTMPVLETVFEPNPKEGMDGYLDIKVQAAYDAENVSDGQVSGYPPLLHAPSPHLLHLNVVYHWPRCER